MLRWRQRTPKDKLRSFGSAYEEAIYAEVVVFFVVVFFAGFFVVMVSEVVREGCPAESARDSAAIRRFSSAFTTKNQCCTQHMILCTTALKDLFT